MIDKILKFIFSRLEKYLAIKQGENTLEAMVGPNWREKCNLSREEQLDLFIALASKNIDPKNIKEDLAKFKKN